MRAIVLRLGLAALSLALLRLARQGDILLPAQSPLHWEAATRSFAAALLRDHPGALTAESRTELRRGLAAHTDAARTRGRLVMNRTAMSEESLRRGLEEAERKIGIAAASLGTILAEVEGAIDLERDVPARVVREVSFPFRSGVLLLRRRVAPGNRLQFIWSRVDLKAPGPVRLPLPVSDDFLAALEFRDIPKRGGRFTLEVVSGTTRLADIDLSAIVPAAVTLRVETRDGAHATEAAVGLYSIPGDLLIPPAALDFSSAGPNYNPPRDRNHVNARYWPGRDGFTRCFFVDGSFAIDVPPGRYRLIASKGPEYRAVDRMVEVSQSGGNAQTIDLERWIDMSARGWHSGDCHIHYARPDQESNQRLRVWTQAEDLRMGNILLMGDARETFFQQYAFGRRGRYRHVRGALVPGQEDPRTSSLGHTINLNVPELIRDAARYYLYSHVFDRVRRGGGLAGYAHVNDGNFLVNRDMSLNVPRGKVDFVEICEFGGLGTELYYEFLNLGFRLTAVGGSDAPYGASGGTSVGDSRVYVYTGRPFDPDEWFEALRRGRTFVTAGPMLDFTVNGHPPGARIEARQGEMLRIRASARVGQPFVPLGMLEVVANGEVVRRAAPEDGAASLELELPADTGMWIAARAAAAHTTPVYVTVAGRRHWNSAAVPGLLEKRLAALDEIEALLRNPQAIGLGRRGNWENAEALESVRRELAAMIGEARGVYGQLREEWQAGGASAGVR